MSGADLNTLFQEVISKHENNLLCSIPIKAKIIRVLKSTYPIKAPKPNKMFALFY